MKTTLSSARTVKFRRGVATLLTLAAGALLVATACTAPVDSGGSSTSKKDGGPSIPVYQDDPELDADEAPTVCNTLAVDDLTAGTVEGSTDDPPAGKGGDLTDGTYVFVKAIMYGLTDAIEPQTFLKSKLVLTGKKVQSVSQTTDGTTSEPALGTTETYTPSGSKLTIATTCPTGIADEEASFSVLEEGGKTQLVVYHSSEGSVIGSFYEKQ